MSSESRNYSLFAAALVLIFLIQAFVESSYKSPSSDEPPHIASGLSYLETRSFHANPQHPPLLKELAGLSLLLGGVHWPHTPEADRLIRGEIKPGEQPEWAIGNKLIADNGPGRVLAWARTPLILISTLLAALLFLWGRQLTGGLAAVGAVLLYTMDPTIMGHAYLVTTDVGVSALTILLLWTLWNYVNGPSTRRLVWCGLALGAVLCAKFSAVLLLPVVPVLMIAAALQPSGKTAAAGDSPRYQGGRNDPCPCGSGKKFKACHGAEKAASSPGPSPLQRSLPSLKAFLLMCVIAFAVIQVLYLFSADPFLYWKGLQRVNADHIKDYPTYFDGGIEPRFLSYFALAWLLKEPLAAIILTITGLVVVWRSRTIPAIGKWFLLLPPAVMFFAATFLADEVGIRYIMPVFPFAHLLGGVGFATLFQMPAKWGRPVAILLALWVVLANAGVYPDRLAYFNESACLLRDPGKLGLDDGTRCGPLWLDDSNVDWGQGLKQLKTWLDVHAPGRDILLCNTFNFPAETYGIRYQPIGPNDLAAGPRPGLYAVTAHMVARVAAYPGASDWLRRTPPTAVVGHSIYIYDMR